MDFQHPQGYDQMETHVPCLSITTNLEKTHKSVMDFLERLIVKQPPRSLDFFQNQMGVSVSTNKADTKQLIEDPNCIEVNCFIVETLESGWEMSQQAQNPVCTCTRFLAYIAKEANMPVIDQKSQKVESQTRETNHRHIGADSNQ